ncbi:DNA polymerase III subunit gamma/tau [bacterium]|nr:MAG: DNA polymerase III subunit gamma/tau [bacterium]
MTYLVLARKWRPQTFDQIRGQSHIVRALKNAIAGGRIAHAYIFTGTRGVGKTSAARVFAKALNCQEGPTPAPCNHCEACLSIAEGRHPDVLEIDGASNNSVDDIRRLRDIVRYAPSQGKYRIYIIDEVHMLSGGAFNALLKTLEEPPPHVVFIFATTDPHKVPVTILSRCQQFDFKRLTSKELSGLLGDICHSEAIEIDDKSLMAIAREAEGSVRDSQSLLDQVISYAGQKVTYQDVMDVLGVVDRELLFSVARDITGHNGAGVLERLGEAEEFGFDVKRFALDLQDLFRDLAVLRTSRESVNLVDLTAEEIAEVRDILDKCSWEELHALFDMISAGLEKLRSASRPGVVFEMTLLKMTRMPSLINLSEIPQRAAALAARTPQVAACPPPAAVAPSVAVTPRAEIARPPAPAPAAQEVAVEPPPPEPQKDVVHTSETLWAEILKRLGPLSSATFREHAKIVHWDAGKRALAIEVEPDHRPTAENAEEELGRIASELSGGKVSLSLTVASGSESTADRKRRETDLERKNWQEAISSPVVRKVQALLGGEIQNRAENYKK